MLTSSLNRQTCPVGMGIVRGIKGLCILSAAIAALCIFPLYDDQHQQALKDQLKWTVSNNTGPSTMFPIVSFNIRLDCEEANPDNHFTRRVHRLSRFLTETAPWVAGFQEPFSGQLLHLQSLLPDRYDALGYIGEGHAHLDRADWARHYDFQTAILFDRTMLKLLKQDHIWLSKTPRVSGSKDWGSLGIRTATVAGFQLRNSTHQQMDIIVFNTHLDVRSELARREQAKVLLQHIRAWQQEHPTAAVFVTGDFNAANGQAPHRIMLSELPNAGAIGPLKDAWEECSLTPEDCTSSNFALTFHGWLGSVVNSYAVRTLAYPIFMLHGSGIDNAMPEIPRSLREFGLLLKRFWQAVWSPKDSTAKLRPSVASLKAGAPGSLARQHVDWILYSSGTRVSCTPRMMYVGEVRQHEFSSDHFPVVGLFELQTNA